MRRNALLAGMACAGTIAASGRHARADAPVKLLTSLIDASAEPLYAKDMGFFRDNGLDVDIETSASGAVVTNGVAASAADIGCANLASVALAYEKGIPFTVVAAGSYYDSRLPTSALVVARDAGIRSARQLEGKTIAAAGLGTITEFASRLWMDKSGADSRSARFVEMAMPSIADALVAGRVDAAILAEPFLTMGLPAVRILAPAYNAVAPRFLIGIFFARLDWARANRAAVSRFQKAMARTATWANAHHDETAAILSKYSKLDPAIARQMLRIGYQPALQADQMQPLIDVLARYGAIRDRFPATRLIFR